MEIRRKDEQTIAITGLSLFLCELLHQIRVSATDFDNRDVKGRLYSSPSGGAEPEFDAEWGEYVEPELRRLFESALEVVEQDLEDFPPSKPAEAHTLLIPMKNVDAWLSALNQARLALAARYKVTEKDMDEVPPGGDTRALALFQIHLYGFIQECFLRELSR